VRARAGHLRWAAHELARARDLAPWNLELHEERARLLARGGDRRGAIAAWEEVRRGFPRHPAASLELARLWEAEGDGARAAEALRRHRADHPGSR
jgi:predicted Zn-dependent protease